MQAAHAMTRDNWRSVMAFVLLVTVFELSLPRMIRRRVRANIAADMAANRIRVRPQ